MLSKKKNKHYLFLIFVSVFFISSFLVGCDDLSNKSSISTESSKDNLTSHSDSNMPKNTISAKVTRVVDGDTVKVTLKGKEETVRMILIDTPETKHPRIGVQTFGPEASDFTKKMLTNKNIQLEMDVQERDQYGRLLAYIWLDGTMFNRILIEKGLARVAIFPPNTKYVDEFNSIQDKARQKEIGIWSIENYATDRGYNSNGQAPASSKSPKPPASGCKIKGNINSKGEKIYHLPNGQNYQQTKAESWFCTENEAKKAGYRKSQR
ncbi:hypothetical protein B4102_1112 [Heyndrickxia sporothermodurans]|uniref:TNase-like domain-containing protein n=1 Tax=Heyndrickxia sporothermodurans TaxID=46224 RepID=A0A150KN09_9BACI|nr:thermonuclease family protein [Heyndrickxia sporothermodurans]KYD00100.1 hypothetical protein B4102_1112 [Heyndrickxia sporothermodurans]